MSRAVTVVGGGIVGLAVAERLVREDPSTRVTVLEKESGWARHQTGRNSGVVHSGLYYAPGSAKARWCRAGAAELWRLAREEDLPHAVTGKLVVATDAAELPRLEALCERGLANGLAVRRLDAAEAREHEPHVAALAALYVPETGVVDYRAVCAALVGRLAAAGADLRLSAEVVGGREDARGVRVETTTGEVASDVVVNCAGLHTDVVARRLGHEPSVRVVPFRGEYRELAPEATHLVRGLVYPVPDPELPFLGVHLTRGVDGTVHAGPNAVLALAREGYGWRTVDPGDLAQTLAYPGLWRLARHQLRTGAAEVARSLSRRRFGDSLRRLVPALRDEDLRPAPAGVRAQAVAPDGRLVDDFLLERSGRCVHVLNAPSPAATASLEIARNVVGLLP
ncbi:L-2-hydroxyglutarate oxidase [Phycicoccus endophyticus]|uniref:L-2-hydroxyglutarate oxidase n=1 Tax=Phycicoccus endophyticus TaxID=1690220 RepID=A0A7G9QZ41_9MICO|nr:L-2-hydroxyglutarate oxidase [Phycicoccus endophyticus]NHI18960.1 L-2-hydroxyglutarate oxidase [Phycicoccus endophyticus]QNN48616.1 L-2-hydroxyglutarate oxidase [Phycicoccus endophyticus]GGL31705.1 hydroxyglutarate oxidase [Phycicoccus endophyticus]